MENIQSLLVALMFITILTLGIAGILSELAEEVRNIGRRGRDALLIGWAMLLLFAYFTLFWHTAEIMKLEEWSFGLFLFTEAGPVLLLFATQILLGALTAEGEGESDPGFWQSRFFVVFGLVQAWSIAAGFVLDVGFTLGVVFDVVVLVTCVVLAPSKSRKLHVAGLTVIWIAYMVSAIFEAVI